MTKTQFAAWLSTHYPRNSRQDFAADFNTVARKLGAELITIQADKPTPAAVGNWLYRNDPPETYGGLTFEDFLARVLAIKTIPAPPATVYAVPVNTETMIAIEKAAAKNNLAPGEYLAQLATAKTQSADPLEPAD